MRFLRLRKKISFPQRIFALKRLILLWEDMNNVALKISSWPFQIVLKAKQSCPTGNNQVQQALVEVMIKLWELREIIFIQAEGTPFVIPVQPCATENQVTFGITVVYILFVCLELTPSVLTKPECSYQQSLDLQVIRIPQVMVVEPVASQDPDIVHHI